MASSSAKQSQNRPNGLDLMIRGQKGYSSSTLTLFILLRLLNLPIQYCLLASPLLPNILRSLSIPTITAFPAGATAFPSISTLFSLQTLLNLPPPRALLLLMSTLTVARQCFWALSLLQEPLAPFTAAAIPAFNIGIDALNSALYFCAMTSSAALNTATGFSDESSLSPPMLAGASLYVFGSWLETNSELQRKSFKKDPRNKGKVYSGGLFAWARHVNYAGFVIWRAGATMVAAGWIGGLVGGLVFAVDFAVRAIPLLDGYCQNRYGPQWTLYKKKTPYKMFPGLY